MHSAVTLASYRSGVPATQHEAGFVAGDDRVHATQKRISGSVAVCGAGAITQPVPGRFDSDDERACAACLEAVSEPV